MPEDPSHLLSEDVDDILQSFNSSDDQHLHSPTTTDFASPFPDEIPASPASLSASPRAMAKQLSAPAADTTKSAFERLPVEIFDQIIPLLVDERATNGCTPRNKDLAACLRVSRTFHAITLRTLYARVTMPHSTIFSKFLTHITKYPELGNLVRRLDFSHFTSVGLGRTKRMSWEIQNLTATTLVQCFELVPKLREFLASESIDEDIDERVVMKLFCELPYLQAIDFCASTAQCFVEGFTKVLSGANNALPEALPALTRVGFHACTTLPPSVFATLLPRLSRLTHLDLTHTQITDGALHALPATARLTHLSLAQCNRLSGPATVEFLTRHPATRGLVYLNMHYNPSRFSLFSSVDVEELLPGLPESLRSLNLNGARINAEHIPMLQKLATHLEELSIAHANVSCQDIHSLFDRENHISAINYLDLTGIAAVTPYALVSGVPILAPSTYPLQVIELSDKVTDELSKQRPASQKRLGWVVRTQGRRGWYVRAAPGMMPGAETIENRLKEDDGSRSWKMGGNWWGGRKIGMANTTISGIYGYYGFGK